MCSGQAWHRQIQKQALRGLRQKMLVRMVKQGASAPERAGTMTQHQTQLGMLGCWQMMPDAREGSAAEMARMMMLGCLGQYAQELQHRCHQDPHPPAAAAGAASHSPVPAPGRWVSEH